MTGEIFYEDQYEELQFVDYETLFKDLMSMIQKELQDCTT